MRKEIILSILFFIIIHPLFAQKKEKILTEPVMTVITLSRAGVSSLHKNITTVIGHAKNDSISGERYAKAFLNGFTSVEKTNGKPIYTTAEIVEIPPSISMVSGVQFYIDGKLWSYKGKDTFGPSYASRLLPILMNDYIKEFGVSKILKVVKSDKKENQNN